ncbi:MAG: hypothetical protein LBG27_07530 [Spirochaetaceae bacterium]|nr:hypothetical protein [Spirochaetaceae bacterium]
MAYSAFSPIQAAERNTAMWEYTALFAPSPSVNAESRLSSAARQVSFWGFSAALINSFVVLAGIA